METDQTIAGLGTLYTWNVVSPRLGVTAKLTADGRTMLRASYGRSTSADRRAQPRPSRRDLDDHHGVRRPPAATRRPSRWSTPGSTSRSTRTRTPRTDEYSAGIERQLPARLAASAAYIRKTAPTSSRGPTREAPTAKKRARWRLFRAGVRAHERRAIDASSDEPGGLLDGLPRAGGRDGKADVERVAGVRLLHVLARGRPAGGERHDRRWGAAQHRGAREHVRQRSQQPHERGRAAAERSPARSPHDRRRPRAADRRSCLGEPAALQRQALGRDRSSAAASGRPAHPARRARIPAALVAIHPRSPRVEDAAVGDAGTWNCCWTCSTCSTTRRRKRWCRTSSPPPRSDARARSSTRGAR